MTSFLEKILTITETDEDELGNEYFVFNERQALYMIKALALEEKHEEKINSLI